MTSNAPERPSDEDFETWCREDRSLAIREARRARESEAYWERSSQAGDVANTETLNRLDRAEAALAAKDAEIAALRGSSALYQMAMERNLARAEKAEARYAGLAEIEKKGEEELERIRSYVEDIEAEVERLRGALERIAHQDIDCGLGKGICDTCNGPSIAREALEGK